MENERYAPVIIPTLCRYEHFKRCIESLSKCKEAKHTKLIIGLDFPLYESHETGYKKICEYIPTITGFEEIVLHKREYNYGPKKNIRALYEYVYSISDRCIYSEDDNEFSPNFLEYINKGLEKFKNDTRIVGICGFRYLFDIKNIKGNAFPCYGFSAWGCGQWRDKTPMYKKNGVAPFLDIILNSWKLSMEVFFLYPTWLNACMTMKLRNRTYGDFLIALECVLYNRVSIFPTISKVRNLGNDGSGVNCHRVIPEFESQPIDEKDSFEYSEGVLMQPPVHLSTYMKVNLVKRIGIFFRYLWYRMTGKDLLKKVIKV